MTDDRFLGNDANATAPSRDYFTVTPSDSVNFARLCRGIYVGGTGDLTVVKEDNTTVAFVNVQAGTLLPIRAIRINATGLTASDMVWLD